MFDIIVAIFNALKVNSVEAVSLAVALAAIWFAYKVVGRYRELEQQIQDLQEKRVSENKQMQQEYIAVTEGINKTLDLLLAAIIKSKGKGSK